MNSKPDMLEKKAVERSHSNNTFKLYFLKDNLWLKIFLTLIPNLFLIYLLHYLHQVPSKICFVMAPSVTYLLAPLDYLLGEDFL
jgi:uncharacterized membrane protein YesL